MNNERRHGVFKTGAGVTLLALTVLIGALAIAPTIQARVFASNVRLGSANTNLATAPGDSVTISYLLNQSADQGVEVSLFRGTNVLWVTNLTSSGTNIGLNTVVWDGTDLLGNTVSNGLWHVKVTATSAGRTHWWKVPMQDNDLVAHNGDGYSWVPWGIAVNNNTNSPHFGRVFVGNVEDSGSTDEAGDLMGIALYNADGSYAIPGGHSTGGWDWNAGFGNGQSPAKIEVGEDDRVYVVDASGHPATVLSFDQQISTNSPPVLALDHDALFESTGSEFSGLWVLGTGANRAMLMTDIHPGAPGGLGIRRWLLGNDGMADTGDVGTTIIAAGSGCDLNVSPRDVTVDGSGRIYAIQSLGSASPAPRILRFPPYQGIALTNADWKIFRDDTNKLDAAIAISAALHTNLLAVVCNFDNGTPITIYRVSGTNGVLLTEEGDGLNHDEGGAHEYTDVAWDRAGNLYATDPAFGIWRVLSPPGPNAFTTVSVQSIKVGTGLQPSLQGIAWKTNWFHFQLLGEAGATYVLETSTNLISWTAVATNTTQSEQTQWSIPSSSPKAFVRARVVQ